MKKNNKAIFLDRDGTIIEDKKYLSNEFDIEFLKNSINGLKKMQEDGYLLFIVTNQSGVARGYFSESDVIRINKYLEDLLMKNGVEIKETCYCPHHIDGTIKRYSIECKCRKPQTGMIDFLVRKYNIDIKKSFVIGDKMSDVELAKNCECTGILINNLDNNECLAANDLLQAYYLIKDSD